MSCLLVPTTSSITSCQVPALKATCDADPDDFAAV